MLPPSATRRLAGTRFGDVRGSAVVDSTNAALLQEAKAGAPEGVVVVADEQTAGRGRLGRTWVAPAGSSLLFSVLLRPGGAALERPQLLTAATALAGAEACRRLAGVQPDLKWPNDLMAGTRKLAGILAEASLPAVVVGMGINVAWKGEAPPEVAGVAVALDELSGREVDRGELLVELLVDLDARLGDLDAVARDYRRDCATLGRRVRIEVSGGAFEGEAVDLTPEGHLVVRLAGGADRVVSAGDVIHLR